MTSARELKHADRERSKRWCPSCNEIRATEWGECERCHAVLISGPKAQVMEHVEFKPPTGTMRHATLIELLNSCGLRPRRQKVNVVSAATPFGEYEEVPHTTQCPICQRDQAYGIYVVTNTDGKTGLELACAQCATSKIPFRQSMGVRTVKHCVLWATIELIAQDSWKITPVEKMER